MKLWVFLLVGTGTLLAQNMRTPSGQYAREASTYEEFDAYIEVVEAQDPERQLKEAASFEQKYPSSELLVFVYEHELDAQRSLNRLPAAKAAAEKALKLTPNNTKVLLALAQLLADDGDPPDEDRASKVRLLVARCLEELGKIKAPRTVPPRQWEETRSRMESEARAANGLVSARSGQVAAAIREFEAAIALNSSPDGAQHFYLGRLYAATARTKDALAMLELAEKLGPDRVRQLALDAISKLR
jgi:tetratricopeptide (TPR) repeat protein